jgi:nitrate reductase NapAB chaperone NapD
MGICSVVITTDEAASASTGTIEQLAQDERWTVGDPQRGMVAAVLETDSPAEDRRCLGWLDEQPGIVAVHLVFAHYGQDGDGDLSCSASSPPNEATKRDALADPAPERLPAEQDET